MSNENLSNEAPNPPLRKGVVISCICGFSIDKSKAQIGRFTRLESFGSVEYPAYKCNNCGREIKGYVY
jgi:hypothetical protein